MAISSSHPTFEVCLLNCVREFQCRNFIFLKFSFNPTEDLASGTDVPQDHDEGGTIPLMRYDICGFYDFYESHSITFQRIRVGSGTILRINPSISLPNTRMSQ